MPTDRPIILLVEDSDADVLVFADALRKARGETFTIEVVVDFFDVLRRSKRHPEPALILVDAILGGGRDGRDLVQMLERDEDVTAAVHLYTGEPRNGTELDKGRMGESVIPAVKLALEPRRNTADNNWRQIARNRKEISDEKAFTHKAFTAQSEDTRALKAEVTRLADAVESMGARWPVPVKLAMVALGSLALVVLLIAFLGRNIDASRLQAQFRDLSVNVNSDPAAMDARIESDGTDYELDTPSPPVPTE